MTREEFEQKPILERPTHTDCKDYLTRQARRQDRVWLRPQITELCREAERLERTGMDQPDAVTWVYGRAVQAWRRGQ